VFDWLDDLDVYVQPSLTEGHGRALVEAMSRGCVAFASNRGGLRESLLPDYLFEPNDHHALARLIARALRDPHYSRHAAAVNFDRAKRFERTAVEARRRAFFKEFIEASTAARPVSC
jgi:glycosyltransferase involved in cell wall biosynthesis